MLTIKNIQKVSGLLLAMTLLTSFHSAHAADSIPTTDLTSSPKKVDFYEATDMYIANVLDPYTDINSVFSSFNAKFISVVQPVAEVYQSDYMIPIRWPLKGAANALDNAKDLGVGTMANLMVGNFTDAAKMFGRSVINLIGLGGMIPLSDYLASQPISNSKTLEVMSFDQRLVNPLRSDIKVLRKPEIDSFNQSFHEWGFGCGVYVVFPFVGGTTGQEIIGQVAEMPLKPDTYLKPIVFVRMAGGIDTALAAINSAKPYLETVDLKTDEGKRQFYNVVRLSVLNKNKCYTEQTVREYAKDQGLIIEDEFPDVQ